MILISSFFTEDIDQVGFKQVIHFFPDIISPPRAPYRQWSRAT